MRRLRQLARGYLAPLGGGAALAVYVSTAVLLVGHYRGGGNHFNALVGNRLDGHPVRGAMPYFYWFGCSVLLYLVVPLVVARLTRMRAYRGFGLGLGNWRDGLKVTAVFAAVMVPVVLVAARTSTFQGFYPLAGRSAYLLDLGGGKAEVSYLLLAAYEASYVAYFVAWEFLFRGFLLNALAPAWGRGPAILATVAPFAIMHVGKAEPETYGSVVAAVALGLLALRTRSIWYGVALHGGIALLMDVISLTWPLEAPA